MTDEAALARVRAFLLEHRVSERDIARAEEEDVLEDQAESDAAMADDDEGDEEEQESKYQRVVLGGT